MESSRQLFWTKYENMTRRKDLLALIFFFAAWILFGNVLARSTIGNKVRGRVKTGYYAGNRNVPVLPDVVVLKEVSPRMLKGAESSWQTRLRGDDIRSVDPMFPAHRGDGSRLSRIYKIKLAEGSDVYETALRMASDPSVEWAEPVYARQLHYDPDDPDLGKQWAIDKVEARAAWDLFRGDTTVVVGIVDTGVDYMHPDLAANIWTNPGEVPENGIDDDNNGFVDDIRGWDFGGNNFDEPDNDPEETIAVHGTAVAGVVSAVTDNGIGIAAPAFNAKIMAVKTSIDADPDHLIWYGYQGIVYAADNGADIINCSWGGSGASNAEREVIAHACSLGVLVVASAGNENDDFPSYPASYVEVLSTAATDENDGKTYYSSFGYDVDVSAPGNNVYTTWSSGFYRWMGGTSFSSAMAASVTALIKGFHPDWTGEQVGEQLRISADPIDDVNPSYRQKLGFGRVNAHRALTVESPSIRLTDFLLVEGSGSNQDGVFDPGEEILCTLWVKNFLEPATGVVLNVGTENPNVTIVNSTVQFASLNTLEERGTIGNPIRLQVDPATPRGQEVEVFLDIGAEGGYEDFDHFRFIVSPTYATIQGGNVRLTITSMGRLGSPDFNTEQGEGFVFGTEENLLFEGALMAATSPNSVSDVARGADQSMQNEDFDTSPGGEVVIVRPGSMADEQGETVFTDENAEPSLNIRVSQTSLAFYDPPDEDYVLLAYRIDNLSTAPIQGLYFGLFMDWDVGDNGSNYADNLPGYEGSLSLGYVYDPNTSLYGGLQVVSEGGATAYKSIDNPNEIYPDAGHYTDAKKWAHLSGGVQSEKDTIPSDYSQVLGVGPLTVVPGDTVFVGFAVLGGEALDELRANATAARAKWQELYGATGVDESRTEMGPKVFRLYTNYPNPFNSETTITYDLAEKTRVVLTIHDLLGREIVRLFDEEQDKGLHEVRWDGRILKGQAFSGVYFYRLRAGSFEKVRKMILIR